MLKLYTNYIFQVVSGRQKCIFAATLYNKCNNNLPDTSHHCETLFSKTKLTAAAQYILIVMPLFKMVV